MSCICKNSLTPSLLERNGALRSKTLEHKEMKLKTAFVNKKAPNFRGKG